MPSLSTSRKVRYSEADHKLVQNVSTLLQFIRDFDTEFETADAGLEQLEKIEAHIKKTRGPKPAKPAEPKKP